MTVNCDRGVDDSRPLPFRKGLRAAFREHRATSRGMATVTTSNPIFNEVMCRSMADLAMLTTADAGGPYPYAGIPWYSTTFGRDGIITAMQMLWCDPRIASGVLQPARRLSGQRFRPARRCRARKNPARDARRRDGGAARGSVQAVLRQRRFDAAVRDAGRRSIPSTPATSRRFASFGRTIEAALAWIDGPGDPDRDGFVEYHRADEKGLVNQGWKDSLRRDLPCRRRARRRARSRCRGAGLCLCGEARWRRAARAGSARRRSPTRSMRRRHELAARFEEAFWCPDIGTYALALDGQKRPCRVRTSNAGQVLFSGIAAPRARRSGDARPDAAVVLLRLGHPHRGARRTRATIRCRTTTARSGRTTTR